jgi:hypothetical protein
MLPVLRELLPFLAALYALDCLTLTRSGQRLFSSWLGRDSRLWQEGLALAGALPLDHAFAIGRFSLAATSERLFLPPDEARGAAAYLEEAWTAVPYEEARELAVEGKEIRFGAGRRWRLATTAEARDLAAVIAELVALPPGARERHAAAWSARALAPEPLLARVEAFESAASPVAALGWALFCALFLALPPLVYFGVPPDWLTGGLLGGAALLWAVIAAASAWLIRRLRREGLVGGEGALLAICLSLPSAMRAALHLGHDLLHGYDFVAAAVVLLPRRAALPLLRAELHGAACAIAGGGGEAWRRLWQERRCQLAGLARHLQLSEREILLPPPRRKPAAAGYCPFCDSEFLPGPSRCGDCGTPLLSWAAEAGDCAAAESVEL